jgi:hypothetical protein
MKHFAASSRRRSRPALPAVLTGLVCAMAIPSHAVLITITNTSSSYYQLRDESAGNTIVTNVTLREGVTLVDVPDNHTYRLHLGQIGDQGSHYFQVTGGQIVFPVANPASGFFTNFGPTALTIGSIPVYFRLLSGANSTIVSGGGDAYFAPQSVTAGGPDAVVNLTPTDGAGFVGNWKNIFPYSFVQHTPVQLGPLGIASMTNPGGTANPGHTTILPGSLVQTNFAEFNGFRFIVDRADSAQPGDGSEWLYFAAPEPSAVALLALAGAWLLRRTENGRW